MKQSAFFVQQIATINNSNLILIMVYRASCDKSRFPVSVSISRATYVFMMESDFGGNPVANAQCAVVAAMMNVV